MRLSLRAVVQTIFEVGDTVAPKNNRYQEYKVLEVLADDKLKLHPLRGDLGDFVMSSKDLQNLTPKAKPPTQFEKELNWVINEVEKHLADAVAEDGEANYKETIATLVSDAMLKLRSSNPKLYNRAYDNFVIKVTKLYVDPVDRAQKIFYRHVDRLVKKLQKRVDEIYKEAERDYPELYENGDFDLFAMCTQVIKDLVRNELDSVPEKLRQQVLKDVTKRFSIA